MAMTTQDTLLAYSEWMDGEGLIVGDKDRTVVGYPAVVDTRTHEELARDFIDEWEGSPLAGADTPLPGL